MKELTKAEELFLLTILRLEEEAYGVTIRKEIERRTGKKYTYGTLYGILDQLVLKDYVIKTLGDPTPERGGRRKTFYRLSDTGLKVLKHSYAVHTAVWDGVDWTALENGRI